MPGSHSFAETLPKSVRLYVRPVFELSPLQYAGPGGPGQRPAAREGDRTSPERTEEEPEGEEAPAVSGGEAVCAVEQAVILSVAKNPDSSLACASNRDSSLRSE